MDPEDAVPRRNPRSREFPRRSRIRPVKRRSGRPPQSRQFRVGRVLGSTFSIWRTHFFPFTLLAVIVFSPYLLLQYYGNIVDTSMLFTWWWAPVDLVLQQVIAHIASAAVIYGVFQQLRGRGVSVGAAVSRGLVSVPSVILVSVLILLCIVVAIVPPMIVGMLAAAGGADQLGVFLVAILAAGCVTFVTCGLFVAVAACVVEQPGVAASLSRSWDLTRGFKWHIFAIVLILGVVQAGLGAVAGGLAEVALGVDWVWLVAVAVAVFVVSIHAVAAAVTYHDLRVAKEGIDTEQLAAIFD